jgi:hypothetical protein
MSWMDHQRKMGDNQLASQTLLHQHSTNQQSNHNLTRQILLVLYNLVFPQ